MPKRPSKTVTCRNIKRVDRNSFRQDLLDSDLIKGSFSDVDSWCEVYNRTLSSLLDKHAPSKLKKIPVRSSVPWYNQDVAEAKAFRRSMERRWRKSKLEIDRQLYKSARNATTMTIRKSKADHCLTQIQNMTSVKSLYDFMSCLLGKTKDCSLPDASDMRSLAEQFSGYFIDKIAKIRSCLDQCEASDSPQCDLTSETHLVSFDLFSEEEVKKLITNSNPTFCEIDPVPTRFLMEFQDILLPVFTKIINLSLASGQVPTCFKEAVVKPLLKKSNLDSQILGNYRPVSNLSFVSKVLEKAVKTRLTSYLKDHSLYDEFQSAYRTNHSTETTLLHVLDTMLGAVDSGQICMLVLLDLSAAFDTIDHKQLLDCLHHRFGLDKVVLDWISSYLSDRTQLVSVQGVRSEVQVLTCGVPQGSVLGPLLFTLYTSSLGNLIAHHQMLHHCYADDTQLLKIFRALCAASEVNEVEECVRNIKLWMVASKLKLNDNKTDILVASSKGNHTKHGLSSVMIGESEVPVSPCVKNLGVLIESDLSMEKHVNSVCQTCYFHIRNIANIRHLLSSEATHHLMRSMVLSRLDYCNSLLGNLRKDLLSKLQKVQNAAARIIIKTNKYSHISPILIRLHWLPLPARIEYKILSLTYKCLNDSAPTYLSRLVKEYVPSRPLRSAHQSQLVIPPARLKAYGYKRFSHISAVLWNSLPLGLKNSSSITTFQSDLKTFLFKKHHNV